MQMFFSRCRMRRQPTDSSLVCGAIYKTLNTSVPPYLSQRINRCVNAQTLRSTAMPLRIQPFARTDFAKRSFRCATPSVWNSLPASVIESDSMPAFKSRLKTFLFRRSFNYSTHNRLPPEPLTSWPNGASQIRLMIILWVLKKNMFEISAISTSGETTKAQRPNQPFWDAAALSAANVSE